MLEFRITSSGSGKAYVVCTEKKANHLGIITTKRGVIEVEPGKANAVKAALESGKLSATLSAQANRNTGFYDVQVLENETVEAPTSEVEQPA